MKFNIYKYFNLENALKNNGWSLMIADISDKISKVSNRRKFRIMQ